MAADEPFSPSIFLNLPPTPEPAGRAQNQKDDDLVLPFIWRMLMEDDIDDNYLHEHTALLQAQQTFADILSSDDASSRSTKSSGSASNTDAPALFAGATWPYDPVQLSRQLLSSTHDDNTDGFGAANGAENTTMMIAMPPAPAAAAGDDGHNMNRVSMDMLNLAFLKGLEEANRFLPITTTSNSLLFDLEATSGKAGRKSRHQNRDWGDDLEGRNSKLMAVEPEEAGEEAREIVRDVYQELLLHAMRGMNITSSSDAEKKTGRKGKGSATEAVDLRTLLIHCAQAIATATGGQHLTATELLKTIRQRSSPTGDATQRLAHCFTRALEARLQGTAAMPAKRASAAELLKAYRLYMEVCCFESMAFKFSNMVICKALIHTNKKKKVHVVDYGYGYGFQWPSLLCFWSRQEGGPPEVRITAVDLPQPGFRPAARIDATGRYLSDFARRVGIPFKFRGIAARWETVRAQDLDIDPDEVLIVNGLLCLESLVDEGADIDSPSPRDMVVRNIRGMRPDAFVLCVENSSYTAPFFVTRFREALFYFSAMFDMMDAAAPRDSAERVLVEQELFGRRAVNVVACEGPDRVQRPEAFKQWQVRCRNAGLRLAALDSEIVSAVRKKVKDKYHRDFFVDVDEEWLLQGWKGRTLYAMSAWVAHDDSDS